MNQESTDRLNLSGLIREHLEKVKSHMIAQMEAYGRNASGRHVKGLKITALPGYGLLYSEEPWLYPEAESGDPAPVMEMGRRGGKIPYGFQEILFQWVKDKGIQVDAMPYQRGGDHKWPDDGVERAQWQFAGAVAFKIMREGTALNRSGMRQDIYTSAVDRECAAILNEARMRFAMIIDNINNNSL